MKVAHVHRIAGIGGSERHLLTLLPALRERGVDARFVGLDVTGSEADRFYEQLDASGVPYTRLSSPRGLVRALRGADLVHTHLVHADVFGALAAARTPLVTTKHNDDPFRVGPWRYAERLLARRARRVICITHALARFNVERVGIPRERIRVVHYGLDEPPAAWGPAPELPEGMRVLLAVSRLVPQKGLDVAVRAVRDRDDALLAIAGDGPLRDELRGPNVLLLGRVGDVAALMRRADVFVHPARWEGFGLVLLEAMLCSLPIVATNVSAIPEIVVDGETGLLVRPEDPEHLADAIQRVLDDPGELGARGRERALREFSVARMAERTLDAYRT